MRQLIEPSAETLIGIEIFAGLAAEVRTEIARRCRAAIFGPGETVVSHRDESTNVYFVVSGTVRVRIDSPTAREVTFRDMGAGQVFGDLSAIDGKPRSAQVDTREESVLAWMPANVFLDVITTYPDVTLRVLRQLTFFVRNLSERVVEFSTLGVNNRLHAELLRLAREHRTARGDEPRVVIERFPTHQELASRISTHREAVTRELRRLEKAGVIARRSHSVTIEDIAVLEQMVEEVKGELP